MTLNQTYTGMVFDIREMRVDTICIEDIAHAFGHICRFNGHCRPLPAVLLGSTEGYNLGLGQANAGRWALLHDAAETYIGDIVRPLKHLPEPEMVFFREFEKKVLALIAAKWGLVLSIPPEVTHLDNMLLADVMLECWPPEVAEQDFLRSWRTASYVVL